MCTRYHCTTFAHYGIRLSGNTSRYIVVQKTGTLRCKLTPVLKLVVSLLLQEVYHAEVCATIPWEDCIYMRYCDCIYAYNRITTSLEVLQEVRKYVSLAEKGGI